MVAKSVVAPFDRIKILYQISSAEFHIYKVPSVAWRIVQNEGMSALWKGNTATMIRVFPYSGIQFMVFDRCKTFLLKEQEMDYVRRKSVDPRASKPEWGLSATESLVSGMIAGAVSVSATYPLDLTRAQLAVLRRKKDPTNSGFAHTITKNYTNRVRIKSVVPQCPDRAHVCLIYQSSQHGILFVGSCWSFPGDHTNNAWDTAILRYCFFIQ
jgi:hypothetical protein